MNPDSLSYPRHRRRLPSRGRLTRLSPAPRCATPAGVTPFPRHSPPKRRTLPAHRCASHPRRSLATAAARHRPATSRSSPTAGPPPSAVRHAGTGATVGVERLRMVPPLGWQPHPNKPSTSTHGAMDCRRHRIWRLWPMPPTRSSSDELEGLFIGCHRYFLVGVVAARAAW